MRICILELIARHQSTKILLFTSFLSPVSIELFSSLIVSFIGVVGIFDNTD